MIQPARSTPSATTGWFERPWGRHAVSVERGALLDALGPLDGRELLELGHGQPRLHAALYAPGMLPGLTPLAHLADRPVRGALPRGSLRPR